MKDPTNPVCRTISSLLSRIGDKWTVLVVRPSRKAASASMSFAGKSRRVSQRMLTLTLRNLERDGLVNRTVTPSIPPRVDYELTELGHLSRDAAARDRGLGARECRGHPLGSTSIRCGA